MRKIYQKPMIMVEDFNITESIAAGTQSCGVKATTLDDVNCDTTDAGLQDWWDVGNFVEGACAYAITGENPYDALCYHSSTILTS